MPLLDNDKEQEPVQEGQEEQIKIAGARVFSLVAQHALNQSEISKKAPFPLS